MAVLKDLRRWPELPRGGVRGQRRQRQSALRRLQEAADGTQLQQRALPQLELWSLGQGNHGYTDYSRDSLLRNCST